MTPPCEVRLTVENTPCSFESCNEPAAVDLGPRALCVSHFFPVCIQALESWNDRLRNQSFDATAIEEFSNFVAACVQQAQELDERNLFADGQLKSQLLEFLRRTSQLRQCLRRSPRLKCAVPVWLRREDATRTWEEETWTTTVSHYGASFLCRHSVLPGGTVILCRRDGGNRVRARVVYCRFDSAGHREIGVELLDQVDIWGLGQSLCPHPAAAGPAVH